MRRSIVRPPASHASGHAAVAVRLLIVAAAVLPIAPAIAGVGDDFGSRDPAVCPLRDAPAKGPPSAPQMVRYFACDTEKVGDLGATMYLLGEVRLKSAPRARAYDGKTDVIAVNADPGQPVYEVGVDFRIYQCRRKDSAEGLASPGHACRYQNFYGHTGLCWKAIGGNWHCALPYRIDPARTVHGVAPPRAGSYLAVGASYPPPPAAAKKKARKRHHR